MVLDAPDKDGTSTDFRATTFAKAGPLRVEEFELLRKHPPGAHGSLNLTIKRSPH